MLPFTREQFLSVFASYNESVWPAQWLAYVLGVVIVLAMLRPSPASDRSIGAGLALMWAWTGIAYHGIFFSAINKAAPVFAALFVLQALLFAHAAWVQADLRWAALRGPRAWLGWALVLYAGLVYPLLGAALGHRYASLPMFGITPCPVTLFSFGVLLLTRQPVPRRLLLIPFLWALVGGSAACLLAVPQDWPLLIGGLLLTPLLWRRGSVPVDAARA